MTGPPSPASAATPAPANRGAPGARHRRRFLGCPRAGDIAYAEAERTGVRSVLVDDADIIEARKLLWDRYRLAAEPGGATAFAALLTSAHQPSDGERIAVVLCGANTDPATVAWRLLDTPRLPGAATAALLRPLVLSIPVATIVIIHLLTAPRRA